MTKFDRGVGKEEVAAEVAKIKAANDQFSKSSQGLLAAAGSCRECKAKFKETEKVALLDRDIQGFEAMSASIKKISDQIGAGSIPDMDSVHTTMSMINDALVYSKMRAQAHKGMPGHFPTHSVKF